MRGCEVQLLIVKESKTFKKLAVSRGQKNTKTCEKTLKEELIKEDAIYSKYKKRRSRGIAANFWSKVMIQENF